MVAAGGLVAVLSSGDSEASASSPLSQYRALRAPRGALGLRLVTEAERRSAGLVSEGPTWTAEPEAHGPNAPQPESIRRLPATSPGITDWIATSTAGGICVLSSPNSMIHGAYVTSDACTESTEGIEQGALSMLYLPNHPETVTLTGVVPDDVRSVLVSFEGGSTQTSAVIDNGWTMEASGTPVSYREIPGGSPIAIGGE